MRCDRCGDEALALTMSRFNTENVCLPCERREQAHPEYQRAKEAEEQAVRNGNLNFPGIGKPADL